MKISICIPQYNRIQFLLKNLQIIARQTYSDIEVVVSDDCSTDDTEAKMTALLGSYRYKLIYHRFTTNQGYDRNLRKSIELASGEYVIVVGNDDTINDAYDLGILVDFLLANNKPEIGFANFIEEGSSVKFKRANITSVLGTGREIALNYYSCFSFVGGILFRRDKFLEFNTDRYDGSIYSQIYLATFMVSKGCRLFSISEEMVIKDIQVEDVQRNSYRDTLIRKWKDYRKSDGGLPSVIHVLVSAMKDANVDSQQIIYRIFRKIYFSTLPFWVLDYKSNKAFPNAVSIIHGMYPPSVGDYHLLSFFNRVKIIFLYLFMSIGALLFPVFVFRKLKGTIYNLIKKR
ncbi:MAG: glycosyltransferase family 2 protein [Chitinophagaceae bacterium]|nr:glycosyltransferase family 2 protein [Chitinophagaceae bacterium]